jgi:Anti-sigma-K factor rskA, C-terminal/Putative zinc-finger
MTPHEWFQEHRPAFVIRTLEPDEERTFREHLLGCEECRTEVDRIERELAWLPMAARPVTPRPGLTRRMVDGVLGRRAGLPRWLVPASIAASVVLAATAWGWAAAMIREVEGEVASEHQRLVTQLAMARDTLDILRNADRVRHASITMGDHHGGMLIFADDRAHRWNVVVYGLPAPHAGEVCQFWFITETGMVRSVPVRTDASAPALLTLPMPPTGGHVMGGALTMEPEGSNGASPEGPELAHLML